MTKHGEFENECDQLVRDHHVAISKYVARRIWNQSDAEDLIADVFATAWRKRSKRPARAEDEILWLYVIARNLVSNFVRSSKSKALLTERIRSEPLNGSLPESEDTEQLGELRIHIQRLSERDKELIRLRYWEELSYRDIALVLSCTEKAAGIRVMRARRRLAESMSEAFETRAITEGTA